MGSNASLSIVVSKGWREGAHPAKSIYRPFVGTVDRFPPVSFWHSHVASPFTLFFLFFGAKIVPTRACEFNSPSWYTLRVYRDSDQSRRLSNVHFESRTQERDFHDRRAYSFDTVYNYVWVRSRAIILSLSIWVQLFWKSNLIDIKVRETPMNHERNYQQDRKIRHNNRSYTLIFFY